MFDEFQRSHGKKKKEVEESRKEGIKVYVFSLVYSSIRFNIVREGSVFGLQFHEGIHPSHPSTPIVIMGFMEPNKSKRKF